MNASDFVGWWNWIFLAPFVVGALMVAITVFGIGDAEDGGADDDGDDGALENVLDKLHLEGVPPMLLLQNFLLWFGVVGWSANRISDNGPNGAPLSVVLAVVIGLVLTLATSRFLAQFTPKGETAATGRSDLEGQIGEATAMITEKSGEAFVRDSFGTLHQIAVRVEPNHEAIARGQQVLVVAYDESDGRFRVKTWTNTKEV